MIVTRTKCKENQYKETWYCRTGNIITVSKVSKEKCVEKHLLKLEKYHNKTEDSNAFLGIGGIK